MDFDTLFPDVRETGETLTRQCQLVMLRMLKVLDYLCTKHNINYFLTGGTMLGAVRHKGFIPWDDDLDVGMTRENYEKFIELAVPELPNDIFFQNDETDPKYPSCHIMEAKLRDKYSRYSARPKPWHNGLQIDISIYDRAYLPHNFFSFVLNRSLRYFFSKHDGKRPPGDRRRAKVLKFIARYSPIPLVYSCSFVKNRLMIKLGTNYIRPKELSKLIPVRFEDMDSWIPVGYDGYLKRRYGNYMQLPPIHKQQGHHSNSNYMQDFSKADSEIQGPKLLPDPFTPCVHKEVLHWKDRKSKTVIQGLNLLLLFLWQADVLDISWLWDVLS